MARLSAITGDYIDAGTIIDRRKHTAVGGETAFELTFVYGAEEVYKNGERLTWVDDYTTATNEIRLNTALVTGDEIILIGRSASNDIPFTRSGSETITLTDGQTEVTFTSLEVEGLEVYVFGPLTDRGRLVAPRDYDIKENSVDTIILNHTFPAGTLIEGVQEGRLSWVDPDNMIVHDGEKGKSLSARFRDTQESDEYFIRTNSAQLQTLDVGLEIRRWRMVDDTGVPTADNTGVYPVLKIGKSYWNPQIQGTGVYNVTGWLVTGDTCTINTDAGDIEYRRRGLGAELLGDVRITGDLEVVGEASFGSIAGPTQYQGVDWDLYSQSQDANIQGLFNFDQAILMRNSHSMRAIGDNFVVSGPGAYGFTPIFDNANSRAVIPEWSVPIGNSWEIEASFKQASSFLNSPSIVGWDVDGEWCHLVCYNGGDVIEFRGYNGASRIASLTLPIPNKIALNTVKMGYNADTREFYGELNDVRATTAASEHIGVKVTTIGNNGSLNRDYYGQIDYVTLTDLTDDGNSRDYYAIAKVTEPPVDTFAVADLLDDGIYRWSPNLAPSTYGQIPDFVMPANMRITIECAIEVGNTADNALMGAVDTSTFFIKIDTDPNPAFFIVQGPGGRRLEWDISNTDIYSTNTYVFEYNAGTPSLAINGVVQPAGSNASGGNATTPWGLIGCLSTGAGIRTQYFTGQIGYIRVDDLDDASNYRHYDLRQYAEDMPSDNVIDDIALDYDYDGSPFDNSLWGHDGNVNLVSSQSHSFNNASANGISLGGQTGFRKGGTYLVEYDVDISGQTGSLEFKCANGRTGAAPTMHVVSQGESVGQFIYTTDVASTYGYGIYIRSPSHVIGDVVTIKRLQVREIGRQLVDQSDYRNSINPGSSSSVVNTDSLVSTNDSGNYQTDLRLYEGTILEVSANCTALTLGGFTFQLRDGTSTTLDSFLTISATGEFSGSVTVPDGTDVKLWIDTGTTTGTLEDVSVVVKYPATISSLQSEPWQKVLGETGPAELFDFQPDFWEPVEDLPGEILEVGPEVITWQGQQMLHTGNAAPVVRNFVIADWTSGAGGTYEYIVDDHGRGNNPSVTVYEGTDIVELDMSISSDGTITLSVPDASIRFDGKIQVNY